MIRKLVLSALVFALAGCGTTMASSPVLTARVASSFGSMGIPPASAFKTVQASVTQILPYDNQGLPHQNFVVKATDGQVYEVNNDTKYGKMVDGLAVGLTLTIKGTVYHDPNKQGIHWTHHANKPGDAGWIKTPDGKIYE